MYAPSRLADEENNLGDEVAPSTNCGEELVNQLDATRVFKGKRDSIKNRTSKGKKKLSVNSKTSHSSRPGLAGFRPPHRY